MDTLLHCSTGGGENGAKPKPCPPRPGEKGEMHVVSSLPFSLSLDLLVILFMFVLEF